MIGASVKFSVQGCAAGPHQHASFIARWNILGYQEKVNCCRHSHLYIEPRRVYAMRKADDRGIATIVPFQHHIASITQWLRLQQLRNLKHVRLNGLIAQKYGESPHPIHYDPHNAHNNGNVQDKGERLHDFSGGVPIIILPQARNQTAQLIILFLHLREVLSMTISEQIQKDLVEAMRSRDELRLSTLRMVKSALSYKRSEERAPLDDKETQQILSTLIKQRRDSIEQFTKGGRQELADKEAAEIKMIEHYLPKAMGEEQIAEAVKATIAEMGSPTMKDMGTVMKNVMAKLQATGARVEGKTVSDLVKKNLAG